MAGSSQSPLSGYRPEMDARAHEETYQGFTHFTLIGTLFVACIVAGLGVGAMKGAWLSAIFMIILAHIAAAIGLRSSAISWRAPGAVLVILLLMLLLY